MGASGRAINHSGIQKPDGMIDCLAVLDYIRGQRHRVARSGGCETGCDHTRLVKHFATGRLVCPRTLEPCPSRRLGQLVGLYSNINIRRNDA